MRTMSKLMGTGCFFLCLGGWVYSGSATGADSPKEAIAKAVAAAAAPVSGETPATASAGEATNLNAPKVKVDAGGNVDFNCQDLDINTALHFLSLQTKKNIIASKDVKGTVTANLYNVTFQEALQALLQPNGFDYIEKGNFIYVYTQKELEEIRKRDRKPVNKIFRLRYVNAADAAVLIKPLLSSTGQVALTPAAIVGIPAGATDTGGNNYATGDTLVINDFVDNLGDIEKALRQLDVRPKQVLVESTILRATLTEDNAFGVDFVALAGSGIDFASLGKAMLNNTSGTTGGTGGTTGGSTSSTPVFSGGPGSVSGGTIPADPQGSQANIGTNFTSKLPQGGLSVGFLSNNISIYVRALEEVTDTTVVANPKILALNKHRGEVFIGNQFGYLTTTTTTTTTQQTVQFLDTGTKLVFRPFIGDDGYVRLEIHPEDSSGGLNNGLPTKSSTEVTSNIMVKDGRTVVIGGLFREQTTAGRGQIPILGNIPVLGVPFRRTQDNTQRTETIVLLTPHIINDDTSLYNESEKQAQDVARMMMGNRAGLQPWGRDRIAQLWYGKANDALERGNTEKARMYTDWALNTNPRFIEAIRLREELTRKKVTEANESSMVSFVRDVIRGEKIMPNPNGANHLPPPEPATAPAPVAPAKKK